MMASLLLKFVN